MITLDTKRYTLQALFIVIPSLNFLIPIIFLFNQKTAIISLKGLDYRRVSVFPKLF